MDKKTERQHRKERRKPEKPKKLDGFASRTSSKDGFASRASSKDGFASRTSSKDGFERLIQSFEEIDEFWQEQGRAPVKTKNDIIEFMLACRLEFIRANDAKNLVVSERYPGHPLLTSSPKTGTNGSSSTAGSATKPSSKTSSSTTRGKHGK